MGDGEVVYASKAFPCTAVLRVFHEEGLSVDVASGGELALARRAGYEGDRIVFHGNAKSEHELRAAAEIGARIVVDNFDDLDKLERIARPRRGDDPRHAGRRRRHPRQDPDRPRRLEVRALDRRRRGSRSSACSDAPWADLRGLHMHIGSQLFDLEPWRLAVEALATLGDFPAYDLGGGLAVAYTPDRRPPTVTEWVGEMRRTADELLGPGKELSIEPGRALVATAGRDALHGRIGQGRRPARRPRPFRRRRRGHVGQHAPDALRRAVRRRPRAPRRARPGTPCTVVGKHCESGDVLIRETDAPGPAAGRRARDPRDRRLRVRDGQQLQRRPAARRSSSAPTATHGWSCAARPTRTCMGETYRVGLLGHGTVGAAFERLIGERADAIEHITGRKPEVSGRPHALARGLRADPRPTPTSSSS